MARSERSPSEAIRERLNHPVIDSDGHTVEFEPGFFDCLREVGGAKLAERYKAEWDTRSNAAGLASLHNWYRLSPEERWEQRATRSPWGGSPTKNTIDSVTCTLPKLLNERLDETGLDFTVLYPSAGLIPPHIDDEELRRSGCRALNNFHADIFHDYAKRMTPVAVIPMHTPQEAIEELEHAVKVLGFKAVMLAGHVVRPIPCVGRRSPELSRYSYWIDTFCLDSAYDYDPVWAKCVELKVPPTFHSAGMGWGSRTSISNYMYNHIGHFASAGEAIAKAMFFGGVTRRFPMLRCAFLECGVGWACSLYADLIGHWKKRNREALENYNPANLNRELLVDLYQRYGGRVVEGKLNDLSEFVRSGGGILRQGPREEFRIGDPAVLDEWAACGIKEPKDIRNLFVPHFFFGCESDDPLNATAFNTTMNPLGARLNAVLSSDIGHWDVPDIRQVLEEAHELVDNRVITEEDFRDFVFTNPVKLWTDMNPDFFKGTVVENDAAKLLTISH